MRPPHNDGPPGTRLHVPRAFARSGHRSGCRSTPRARCLWRCGTDRRIGPVSVEALRETSVRRPTSRAATNRQQLACAHPFRYEVFVSRAWTTKLRHTYVRYPERRRAARQRLRTAIEAAPAHTVATTRAIGSLACATSHPSRPASAPAPHMIPVARVLSPKSSATRSYTCPRSPDRSDDLRIDRRSTVDASSSAKTPRQMTLPTRPSHDADEAIVSTASRQPTA